MISATKKPLNMIEAPIYPDIRKAPPKVKTAGKHWTVDVGLSGIAYGVHDPFDKVAILAQDYDANTRGKTSMRSIVNATLRPPPVDLTQSFALHKIPVRMVSAIRGREFNGAPSEFHSHDPADLVNQSQIRKAITDRIKSIEVSSGYSSDYKTSTKDMLPNVHEKVLELNLPSISVSSGYSNTYDLTELDSSGYNKELVANLPSTSVTSGFSHIAIDDNLNGVAVDLKPTTKMGFADTSGYEGYSHIDVSEYAPENGVKDTILSSSASAGFAGPELPISYEPIGHITTKIKTSAEAIPEYQYKSDFTVQEGRKFNKLQPIKSYGKLPTVNPISTFTPVGPDPKCVNKPGKISYSLLS